MDAHARAVPGRSATGPYARELSPRSCFLMRRRRVVFQLSSLVKLSNSTTRLVNFSTSFSSHAPSRLFKKTASRELPNVESHVSKLSSALRAPSKSSLQR